VATEPLAVIRGEASRSWSIRQRGSRFAAAGYLHAVAIVAPAVLRIELISSVCVPSARQARSIIPPVTEVAMTSSPMTSDDRQPHEWNIGNRTLILSADSHRALAVLNRCDPLLLPPGSVLQFDDPPGELVVTRIRVILGEGGAIVCVAAEPAPRPVPIALRQPQAAPQSGPGTCGRYPSQTPWWSQVRPGNG
jgi:hypothetical protein